LNAGLGGRATGAVMGGGLGAVAAPRAGLAEPGLAGDLSTAAPEATFENTPEPAALPAPGLQGLPPPEPVFYADSEGNVQDTGPVRNVDGARRPEPQARQWINPQNDPARMPGGPGMDQQAPQPLRPARPIDQQADQAATSPNTDLPAPTPAQIEAGNYRK